MEQPDESGTQEKTDTPSTALSLLASLEKLNRIKRYQAENPSFQFTEISMVFNPYHPVLGRQTCVTSPIVEPPSSNRRSYVGAEHMIGKVKYLDPLLAARVVED